MFQASRHTATLATVSALILGASAIASAAPDLQLDLAAEQTEQGEAALDAETLTVFEESTDTPSQGPEQEADGDEDEGGDEVDDDGSTSDDLDDEGDRGTSSEFAAWVQSIPSEWGCVKGQLIRAHASGDKTGFAAPSYADIGTAISELDLEGRRCAEVARARVTGSDVAEADAARGPESQPGPPDHAQTKKDDAGPPADRGNGGPPADRGNAGPPADRGNGGPPADRGNGGPPEGRGGR